MDIQVFKRVVEQLKTTQERTHALAKLGIEVYSITDDLNAAISHLVGAYYGQEGLDTFEWWCWDKDWGTRTDLRMTNADGISICETIEDLHQYLEDTAAPFTYTLPVPMTDAERMELMESMFPGIKDIKPNE
jgi:hypothetical protein